ncbi:tRNA-dependent cyclodipeptide synthase [Streptomyces sp. WAC04114]|uniref:tRNA-dependent cyclodipeptide synthase n=1 Tax=Streptomyces sp. WAC04114 TaxID=2867961 RepID=UPI001C8CAD57|nr:tRNA-dependent cyclodipeptide synthase [Streptomyces sp. WAC04114]MBX9362960.1 tRNA-dependent cyclodipeptide synthase [Streptomyces sp. WAC04114]
MSSEIAELANAAAPLAMAALGAYGSAVLLRTQEEAATSTVNAGRRLLQRVFGARADDEANPDLLVDLLEDPNDADSFAALRREIRKVLDTDEELVTWLRQQVATTSQSIIASGDRSIAMGTNNGVAATGDNNKLHG